MWTELERGVPSSILWKGLAQPHKRLKIWHVFHSNLGLFHNNSRIPCYGNYYQDDGDDTLSLEVLQGNAEKMLEGSNDNNDPSQSRF